MRKSIIFEINMVEKRGIQQGKQKSPFYMKITCNFLDFCYILHLETKHVFTAFGCLFTSKRVSNVISVYVSPSLGNSDVIQQKVA